MDYRALIEKCEDALRAGRGQVVAHLLGEINTAKIPRDQRVALANICRRASLISLGLRILTALVREEEATDAERAEYAVLLERCGAVDEALVFLKGIDTRKVPAAHLYRAFCHFKSWDYAAAIPELREYVATGLPSYAGMIAQVNLAAALVVTRDYEGALDLLTRNIETARSHNFSRLQANCLELTAQVHFHQRDFAAARASLNTAAEILGRENTIEQFFVLKWQKILDAFESGRTDGLSELRARALERGDGESVREADLFQLMIRRDPDLLRRLYLGTPFAAYRERIRHELKCDDLTGDLLIGSPDGPVLDVLTGEISSAAHAQLKPGKKNHQLLAGLLRDLYRPMRVGGLFAYLYPNEHFDIYTSPARVHQILFRTRQWLSDHAIPVQIVEHNQAYSLDVRDDFAFRIPALKADVGGYAAQVGRLIPFLASGRKITSREACAVLGVSLASSKRILKWGCEHGKMRREGSQYSLIA